MCDLMKIRGVYILTLRNIKRMIAVLAAAFFASCTSATSPENIAIAGRISNATLTLKVPERQANICEEADFPCSQGNSRHGKSRRLDYSHKPWPGEHNIRC